MKKKKFIIPDYIISDDVKNVRKKLGLTQAEFADLMGCSKPTVVRWESSEDIITGPVVLAVYALQNDYRLRDKIVLPPMKYRLRLSYMYRGSLCTIIDVDETNEKIEILNFCDNIQFRAFGSVKNPTYSDYLEFIESRCFPRTRDKIKLVLEDLNLPFYDPLMIIEKTQGKMAEDDFWIEVERV